jgi:dihydroceramide fatty acyl 2-hydroxylase
MIWGPVVVLLIALSVRHQLDGLGILGMAAAGVLLWTAAEYFLHRYVFHFVPKGPLKGFQERVVYLIHGIHHDQPEDATRLVMPPAASVGLGILFYLLFRAIFGEQWVMPFFAGFLAGYLCYDYAHYAIHHFLPKNRVLKYLKNHHMKHHYMTHGARWGVSSPLWDILCGTMKERVSGERRGA